MKGLPSKTKGTVQLTETEHLQLDTLYVRDGAWTPQEAAAAIGQNRTTELIQQGVLGRCDTDMGPMLLLLAPGRLAVFGTSGNAQSLSRQIDRAYLRRCLEQLGWRQTEPGETKANLWQYDTTGRMVEVETQRGLALVSGSLRYGGIGRRHVAHIASRLKSTALFHNFDVILLTPHPRKAHRRAVSEAAFMILKTVMPVNPDFANVRRIKQLPGRPVIRANIPYLAGESWMEDPSLSGLPDLTKRILQMPRTDRIDQALRSIECDGVLSNGQLKRYYGLDLGDITSRPYIETIVRPTHSDFRTEANVTFVLSNRKTARLDDTSLGHRAGTSEMRHQMGVSSEPRSWKAEQREALRFEEPDAYYYGEDGQIHAIEFDTGTYTANVIDDKLSTFSERGFTGVLWGVTSVRRQANLTDKIRDRLSGDVLLCPWWRTEK